MDILTILFLVVIVFMIYVFIRLSIIDLCIFQDSVKNFKLEELTKNFNPKEFVKNLKLKDIIESTKLDKIHISLKEGFSYGNTSPLFIQSHPRINDLSSRIPSTNELINNRVFDPSANFRY